ncbi:serine/threonine-protein kinase [Streptomyces sp. NPDC051366]|uniref:serine/threonine-protein kinase n=1 Tax=Streptomyces sp. NPDC051366 TaxID=3365652 RepID=UPI0037B1BB5D
MVGRYRIVARLGAGGMGQVYLARSPGGRPVAVKVVRPELATDRDFRRRFAREVAAARRVNGAFTAGVVDADPDGSPAWLATVYVPGLSLGEAISVHGPWPAQSVVALGAGLVEGLEAIHGAGVVHRDLKPGNVLLAADGPRVIDFGISVASEASALTSTGTVIGTPGFMSPEQLTGRSVGPASDVFSLGALLAYTATGVGPFGTGTPHALHFRAVYEQPDLDRLPAELRPVVTDCLAKQPDHRPTVADLLHRLTTADGGDGGDGRAESAVTLPLPEHCWMPDRIAQAVEEYASSSLSETPAPTPQKKPLIPLASDQPAIDALVSAPPKASDADELPVLRIAPASASEVHRAPAPAGEEPERVPLSSLHTPDRSASDAVEQLVGRIRLVRNGPLAGPLDASEPVRGPEPPSGRRRWLALAFGVALAAAAIPVTASLWSDANSDSSDDRTPGIARTSSPDSSPTEAETAKSEPPSVVKLPEPCQTISRTTIELLVPNVKKKDGTVVEETDTTACFWNGLEDDPDQGSQYRWLDVSLWRYDSDSALGSGKQQAQEAYAKLVANAQGGEGARNVRTDSVSDAGDQATVVSSDLTRDGDVYRDAELVARTGSAVVRLNYHGTGFVGAAPPATATMVQGATTAAKEVLASVTNANK